MLTASAIGIPAAFLAGLISFLSPCVLPLVPGYVSYVAGRTVESAADRASIAGKMGSSLCFVLGFSTVFTLLGVGASSLGEWLRLHRYEAGLVGGSVVILFGLFATGFIRLPWLDRDFRIHPRIAGGTPSAAYLLGLAFGFGWTPCIGPILGAILTVTAVSTSLSGIALLLAYSAGLGLPFIASAFLTDRLAGRIRPMARIGRLLQIAAGGTMVLMGLAVVTGRLNEFSVWLLKTFPQLATIG
ncbi:MAG: cytochrome c biogenesis CcdA family protein [Pseudomonadota bacterium]